MSESKAASGESQSRAKRTVSRSRAGTDQERKLIEVAARMFAERGYGATSVQDIADELGLLKGSLYHYIDSKDDLLWAVISKQHEIAMALAERCRAMDATPREKLSAFIDDYVPSLTKERIFAIVYLHDLNSLSPKRRNIVIEGRGRYLRFVEDTLREGQELGEFRDDLIPALAANALLGMLTAAYRWHRPGRHSPRAVVEQCKKIILDGVDVAGAAVTHAAPAEPASRAR
jgi:TetR/AcrR family transcriptional regulator, cholesterol catabolism regulator